MTALYSTPRYLRNGHVQSIYPSLFRRVNFAADKREKIATPDGDFLNLDWALNGHRRLVVLSHGLEGHTERPYMLGMMRSAVKNDYDVLAWNFRSCGNEDNRHYETYHSGQIRDLELVVQHGLAQGYDEIRLVGFSIGGNKTLRFLALGDPDLVQAVKAACVFSVPVDLESCAYRLAERKNAIYMKNFLVSFEEKLKQKQMKFPDRVDMEVFAGVKNFIQYDELFTAPTHGFESAHHYWSESSSKPLLGKIQTPTLLVSALDDPFLSEEAYPSIEAERSRYFQLETPKYGGHVGFMTGLTEDEYWSERRAFQFFREH